MTVEAIKFFSFLLNWLVSVHLSARNLADQNLFYQVSPVAFIVTLKVKAGWLFKPSAITHLTTWHHIPGDCNLQQHCYENDISYSVLLTASWTRDIYVSYYMRFRMRVLEALIAEALPIWCLNKCLTMPFVPHCGKLLVLSCKSTKSLH